MFEIQLKWVNDDHFDTFLNTVFGKGCCIKVCEQSDIVPVMWARGLTGRLSYKIFQTQMNFHFIEGLSIHEHIDKEILWELWQDSLCPDYLTVPGWEEQYCAWEQPIWTWLHVIFLNLSTFHLFFFKFFFFTPLCKAQEIGEVFWRDAS